MAPLTPRKYVINGQKHGIDKPVLTAAARQMSRNREYGTVPILSLGHLAHLCGVPVSYLRNIVERAVDPYQEIKREKPSGGVRRLSAPEPLLMDVQRRILSLSFSGCKAHDASFAYTKGRSIRDCAERHVGARWLIKLDLHNFFDDVSEYSAYSVFLSRGYSKLVSLELARLCTRASVRGIAKLDSKYKSIPSYSSCSPGSLPQGAPTSGVIANLAARPLDQELAKLAEDNGLTYTRYSDDLTFSTIESLGREEAARVISEVDSIVRKFRFTLHRKKTRVVPPGARHIVLGLLVDGDDVRLTNEYRRMIDIHLRGVDKFGLAEHYRHRKFDSLFSFINFIDGSLAFAHSIQPDWTASRKHYWDSMLKRNKFPS